MDRVWKFCFAVFEEDEKKKKVVCFKVKSSFATGFLFRVSESPKCVVKLICEKKAKPVIIMWLRFLLTANNVQVNRTLRPSIFVLCNRDIVVNVKVYLVK